MLDCLVLVVFVFFVWVWVCVVRLCFLMFWFALLDFLEVGWFRFELLFWFLPGLPVFWFVLLSLWWFVIVVCAFLFWGMLICDLAVLYLCFSLGSVCFC